MSFSYSVLAFILVINSGVKFFQVKNEDDEDVEVVGHCFFSTEQQANRMPTGS